MKYTKESLQNTWGVVESKDHAEFIVELAELHGFFVSCKYVDGDSYFRINGTCVIFCSTVESTKSGRKQITIPLPPKTKEWPQVGDEVALRYKFDSKQVMHTGKLLYISDSNIIIETTKNVDYHCHRCDWVIEKPKSEQELKIEELQAKLCDLNAVDNYILASEIVMGNVEGLSYE